jgi:SAM-dependent methyltransferase
LRFVQLIRGLELPLGVSLNDLGCGYGALVDYLDSRHASQGIDYLGIDVSLDMVNAARERFAHRSGIAFAQGSMDLRLADYGVASGIFNVRLDRSLGPWEEHIRVVLQRMASHVRTGFAINMLDIRYRHLSHPRELYFGDPRVWRDWCEKTLGLNAIVIDGYGMKEFTLVCRH